MCFFHFSLRRRGLQCKPRLVLEDDYWLEHTSLLVKQLGFAVGRESYPRDNVEDVEVSMAEEKETVQTALLRTEQGKRIAVAGLGLLARVSFARAVG